MLTQLTLLFGWFFHQRDSFPVTGVNALAAGNAAFFDAALHIFN